MKKDKDIKNKNKDNNLTPVKCAAIVAMIVFVVTMIVLVGVVIHNMCSNPINTAIDSLNQSTDEALIGISGIVAITSNAISSTTLIVTVVGIFMTGVSVFAALIVYITNAKLDDVDKKIDEFDTRINVETYMRHAFSENLYMGKKQYGYAIKEFEPGLKSDDDACRLSANYYMGLVYNELSSGNGNSIYLDRAQGHWLNATQFASDIDPIISSDSYASLGCLYGLKAESNFKDACCADYLKKAEEFLKKAIHTLPLPVHYKNLAVTYSLKRDAEKAIEYIEKGIQLDAIERGITDENERNKNAKKFVIDSFTKEEKELIPETYHKIIDYFVSKYNFDRKDFDKTA